MPSNGSSTVEDLLLVVASTLTDLETVRIAMSNRLWDLKEKKGLQSLPEIQTFSELKGEIEEQEHVQELLAGRILRRHPLGPFIQETPGLGLKQSARLLAALGDPTYNYAEDRPRKGPGELWAYAGFAPHQIGRKRGETLTWNPEVKKRTWLCANSVMKQRHSPYRAVYEDAKARAAKATHLEPCPRCAPAGKAAPSGSELSPGHQHARALRAVSKAILKDLFNEMQGLKAGPPLAGNPAGTHGAVAA